MPCVDEPDCLTWPGLTFLICCSVRFGPCDGGHPSSVNREENASMRRTIELNSVCTLRMTPRPHVANSMHLAGKTQIFPRDLRIRPLIVKIEKAHVRRAVAGMGNPHSHAFEICRQILNRHGRQTVLIDPNQVTLRHQA